MAKSLPKRLTREEVAALLRQPNPRYPTGVRDRALIRVMYCAGLRCAEALALTPRDLQLGRGEIRVNRGKGGKDRVVWVDETTIEILDRWRAIRPPGERFFCTLAGRPLAAGDVRKMMARRGAKAGIAIRVHPHLLRHSYASELLEDGYTVAEVKHLLGHARLETTSRYLHIAESTLQRRLASRKVGLSHEGARQ